MTLLLTISYILLGFILGVLMSLGCIISLIKYIGKLTTKKEIEVQTIDENNLPS